MWRICRIEGFGSELKFDSFRDLELSEEAKIQICRPRALQRIEAYCAEPDSRYWCKRSGVIKRISGSDPA